MKLTFTIFLLWSTLIFTGGTLNWEAIVQNAAVRNGVPPYLMSEVCFYESSGRWWIHGKGDAVGLCQLRPKTASEIANRAIAPWELMNPYLNADLGAKYLARMYRRSGFWFHTLVAYNGGPRSISWQFQSAAEYPKHTYTHRIWHRWQWKKNNELYIPETRWLDFLAVLG